MDLQGTWNLSAFESLARPCGDGRATFCARDVPAALDARAVLAALEGGAGGAEARVAETVHSLCARGFLPGPGLARRVLEDWTGQFSRRRMVIALVAASGTGQDCPPWSAVRPGTQPGIMDIVEWIGGLHGATAEAIVSSARSPDLARVRFFCEWGCRQGFGYPLQAIGNRLGGRSHTSVLNGVEKASLMLSRSPAIRRGLLEACDAVDHAAMMRAAALTRPG